MSKKRILSNGYSSNWRDDMPKKELVKPYQEEGVVLIGGKESIERFSKAMAEELIKMRNRK
jgi:hypothetical protein